MTVDTTSRLLLRALLHHHNRDIVGHTTWLDGNSMFVQTDEPAEVGDRVAVTLSFPGLLGDHVCSTTVAHCRPDTGPGEPAGWTLKLDVDHSLSALLRNVPKRSEEPRPYRVLLVEDSKFSQQMFEVFSAKFFRDRAELVELHVADDVEAAKQLLGDLAFDLAIVDYLLDADTGDRLVKYIRDTPEICSVGVVAVSTGGGAARVATMAAGADMFIHKPLVLADLFSTLERLVPQ